MQKTCAEIIDETLAAGYTLNNRGTDSGGCFYISPSSGVMCAVGRCCEAPQADWYGPWTGLRVGHQLLEPDAREQLLKPEYRGHSAYFWMCLQGLHDNCANWTETGLSDSGQKFVDVIRKNWCKQ